MKTFKEVIEERNHYYGLYDLGYEVKGDIDEYITLEILKGERVIFKVTADLEEMSVVYECLKRFENKYIPENVRDIMTQVGNLVNYLLYYFKDEFNKSHKMML